MVWLAILLTAVPWISCGLLRGRVDQLERRLIDTREQLRNLEAELHDLAELNRLRPTRE